MPWYALNSMHWDAVVRLLLDGRLYVGILPCEHVPLGLLQLNYPKNIVRKTLLICNYNVGNNILFKHSSKSILILIHIIIILVKSKLHITNYQNFSKA